MLCRSALRAPTPDTALLADPENRPPPGAEGVWVHFVRSGIPVAQQ
jgi:hypothetical protein